MKNSQEKLEKDGEVLRKGNEKVQFKGYANINEE